VKSGIHQPELRAIGLTSPRNPVRHRGNPWN
jgi:hypothetical protein